VKGEKKHYKKSKIFCLHRFLAAFIVDTQRTVYEEANLGLTPIAQSFFSTTSLWISAAPQD
jgi:hypothetical protein